MDRTEERTDPGSASTQLKQSRVLEKIAPRNKVKETKRFVDPTMLIDGDMFDIGEIVREVTKDELQEMRMEQNTVFGPSMPFPTTVWRVVE